ncbi:hypothetical protein DdX_13831 [Ditylenchus destructor]|uniref:Uncharacterized protein n=1 Tax=Ditylenchus destructor TaxID=166010 RepID=A0AAD4MSU3_9BILA|nr:hypothetical protein DdX_13831 [Ditylenchus destructor]
MDKSMASSTVIFAIFTIILTITRTSIAFPLFLRAFGSGAYPLEQPTLALRNPLEEERNAIQSQPFLIKTSELSDPEAMDGQLESPAATSNEQPVATASIRPFQFSHLHNLPKMSNHNKEDKDHPTKQQFHSWHMLIRPGMSPPTTYSKRVSEREINSLLKNTWVG